MDIIKDFYLNKKEKIKEQKKCIINYLIKKAFSNKYISKNNISIWIKTYHYSLPLILLLLISLGNIYIATFTLIISIIIAIGFFYFRGCLISTLEYNICNDKTNIIDIWIEYFECKKINYDNGNKVDLHEKRFKYSIITGSIWFFINLFVYYYRFII